MRKIYISPCAAHRHSLRGARGHPEAGVAGARWHLRAGPHSRAGPPAPGDQLRFAGGSKQRPRPSRSAKGAGLVIPESFGQRGLGIALHRAPRRRREQRPGLSSSLPTRSFLSCLLKLARTHLLEVALWSQIAPPTLPPSFALNTSDFPRFPLALQK